jgi:hypothetical protein
MGAGPGEAREKAPLIIRTLGVGPRALASKVNRYLVWRAGVRRALRPMDSVA